VRLDGALGLGERIVGIDVAGVGDVDEVTDFRLARGVDERLLAVAVNGADRIGAPGRARLCLELVGLRGTQPDKLSEAFLLLRVHRGSHVRLQCRG